MKGMASAIRNVRGWQHNRLLLFARDHEADTIRAIILLS
jgi:hypothetical protein